MGWWWLQGWGLRPARMLETAASQAATLPTWVSEGRVTLRRSGCLASSKKSAWCRWGHPWPHSCRLPALVTGTGNPGPGPPCV